MDLAVGAGLSGKGHVPTMPGLPGWGAGRRSVGAGDEPGAVGGRSAGRSAAGEGLRDPREVADVEPLAARLRVHPGRHQRGGRGLGRAGQAGERRAEHLAALGERGVDDREDLLARVAVVRGGSRRSSATSAESTFGTGQKTVRATVEVRRAEAYQATFADGTP